jgi:hypothetical protein
MSSSALFNTPYNSVDNICNSVFHYSPDSTCADIARPIKDTDKDVPSGGSVVEKTVGIRLNAEAVRSLLYEFPCVTNNNELWSGITHIYWDYGRLACDGTLVSCEDNEVLTSPSTYEKMVRDIATRNSIQFVMSLPSYPNDPYMTATIRNCGSHLLRSIMTNAEPTESIEIDFHMLYAILSGEMGSHRYSILTAMKSSCDYKWIISFSNAELLPEDAGRFMEKLLTKINVVAIIVRSFGFQNSMEIRTSHGNYRTTYIQPNCSLRQFADALAILKSLIPVDLFPKPRIIMEMDTRAVEYFRKKTHHNVAEYFELLPLRELRHRKLFGCTTFAEQYDANCSSAMIDFSEKQSVVSYDNPECRKRKFDYIIEEDLDGVLLGEPHYDISPLNPLSLVCEAKARLRPAGSPVSAPAGHASSPVCRLYGSRCPSIENHRGTDDDQGP